MNIDELKTAAEQGDEKALHELIFSNLVTSRDDQEAEKWIQLAVKQGKANTLYTLGLSLLMIGKADQQQKLTRLAAELGHPDAQNDVGIEYLEKKMMTEAHKWFCKAAEQGNASAQYNLGLMYEHGSGVTKDIDEAWKWYNKAAAQGHDRARDRLRALRSKALTEDLTSSSKEGEGCYIATSVYGSYDASEVLCLRQFRDETLATSLFGRLFIRIYYFLSPPIAKRLKNMKRANAVVRRMLDAFIQKCLSV